ncbi:MAG TPA: M48 family metalloprotease, partial [Pyrinomonadaceae bacterium]|nr:M48 family metalloprotease [Pyrinomonadaceae bacterium]
MYELLGISLVLAMLLTINLVATPVAAGVARLFKKQLLRCTARTRAEILFALRTGPPAIAIVSIFALLIPSYLVYEPYTSGEIVSKKLATLATISGVGVMLAFWRGWRSWWATRSLLQQWLGAGVQIELRSISVPTYRLPHTFPLIAVVGAFRPRLFIAEHVLSSLSEEELVAAVAHECGHLAAHDNFKRSLLRASRAALLMAPFGRSLDRAWAEAAESAADEYAARESSSVALNLASALVRIAKMIPGGDAQKMPALVSNFLTAGEEARGV